MSAPGDDDDSGGGRARGGLAPALDPALVDHAPREATAPPPGKRALTDYLPPSARGAAKDGPYSQGASAHRADGRGHSAIHRPPAPAHPKRAAAPTADAPEADDPFALHIASPNRVRLQERLTAGADATPADTKRPPARIDDADE